MQYSTTIAILAALSNLALGAPLISRQSNPPSIQHIADAQNEWAADTSKVSQFLSAAENLSPTDLVTQAATALANEKDELLHKMVLDNEFLSSNPSVQQANDVLVNQGKFQDVVNGLQDLADNGGSLTSDEVTSRIQTINQGRCTFVLPAIDTYFQASSSVLNNGLLTLANRPDNCP